VDVIDRDSGVSEPAFVGGGLVSKDVLLAREDHGGRQPAKVCGPER
jgi:hypothetical protein